MKSLNREFLLDDVRKLFSPAAEEGRRKSKAIGAELELIPVNVRTGQRVLADSGRTSGADLIASIAREFGWTEESMAPDPSCWDFSDGRVTFEPGGQIELSSAVFSTASELLASLEKWTDVLMSRARSIGVALKTIGIEERVPIGDVPLQLHRERYVAMTRYFESVGPFGAVMMRQTASLQINVDRGENPLERWRLLNALAPFLVAIFANSRRYAGVDTGHKAYRTHVWRMLDTKRTGIIYDAADPARRYFEFALEAPVILAGRDSDYPTFRELLDEKSATKDMWDTHLSTLFPEIRPRDYFEIRSIDAIEPAHLCAAVALVCGIVYCDQSASDAKDFLGNPDSALLERAGKMGLADPDLRDGAANLVGLALAGCRALGSAYLAEQYLSQAEQFFERYTFLGRSPGDDR